MNPNEERLRLNEEVFAKYGRNVLGFQHCERLLKLILPSLEFAGPPETIEDVKKKLLEEYSGDTLGQLIGKYVELMYGQRSERVDSDEDPPAPHVAFSFKLQGDVGFYEERKNALKEFTNERNHLVHHFLERWDRTSQVSSEDAILYLTKQLDRIRTVIGELNGIFDSMSKAQKAQEEYFASEQFEIDLLRHSTISVLLGQLAANEGDTEGWISMSRAGTFLHELAADDMKALEQRYGVGKLKELMVKTGLFDFREDATEKGFRTMYRVNPRWVLKIEAS